jgi:hypothetical protein
MRAAARSTYVNALKEAREAVAELLSTVVTGSAPPQATSDAPPDFSKLAADAEMQAILTRRWEECQRCISAGAPLAATVMMGGLLEALCVARANKMADKAPLFKQKTTPLDPQTKKPLQLKDWTLRAYLDVGHDLNWISRPGKDIAVVLRDYRNYIHPQKEYSHGVILDPGDAQLFWELAKGLCRQILT